MRAGWLREGWFAIFCFLVAMGLMCHLAASEQTTPDWQQQVRRSAEMQDWNTALRIVESEIARAPHDLDLRAWRARVLMWSGRLTQAEQEYRAILALVPDDPDDWMGLANVYSREGRNDIALQAIDHALQLDPGRSDLHAVRGRTLVALNRGREAKSEFHRALELDPRSEAARAGLLSLREHPAQELRIESETDMFNYTGVNQSGGLTLISRWTPGWRTTIGEHFYHWAGTDAEKFGASLSRKLPSFGLLMIGGAAAHDNAIVPKREAFFAYDQGWKVSRDRFLRGVETVYEQHWYWYTTARILSLRETEIFYFPRDWTWSFAVTEARSHFSGTGVEWRPAGFTKLGFPLMRVAQRQLGGNLFFGTGTENYSLVNEIGHFSAHTYGAGLRLPLTERQDADGFVGYQQRSQNRTETLFGISYGIRF
jgi:tetratricopeptide (TPR) repeat protein